VYLSVLALKGNQRQRCTTLADDTELGAEALREETRLPQHDMTC